ncbi:Putative tyrosine-protein kinase YveL [Paenibacillus solanacearum]|uniref:non-specific protein-tyrosine kinase n=2 Tax=Paenibacillus solanacearum TaxID=2048548 RepID=A0A916NPA7_9BACL|nr:Putative tyrosine-protein kinase YveL [Paenibacillus solanacearum]
MPKSKDNIELLPQVDDVFMNLKVNLDFSIKKHGMQSIAVVSTSPGEGRTTSCLNLALSYATSGKKVVLLDADLRKPAIHSWFNDSNQLGLCQYLTKLNSSNEILKNTRFPNLTYIPTGYTQMNPSGLLSSEEFDRLMQELKNRFDVIVVDTPPALKYIDAKIMAAKCDGVLLVMECGKVKPGTALKLKEELAHAEARLIGTLLNKVSKKSS